MATKRDKRANAGPAATPAGTGGGAAYRWCEPADCMGETVSVQRGVVRVVQRRPAHRAPA